MSEMGEWPVEVVWCEDEAAVVAEEERLRVLREEMVARYRAVAAQGRELRFSVSAGRSFLLPRDARGSR